MLLIINKFLYLYIITLLHFYIFTLLHYYIITLLHFQIYRLNSIVIILFLFLHRHLSDNVIVQTFLVLIEFINT